MFDVDHVTWNNITKYVNDQNKKEVNEDTEISRVKRKVPDPKTREIS